jgi:phosphate transport system permease protein
LVFFASLIGLPIGLMTGIYLARAGSGPFAQIVRFVTDVIAGTPSIVAGMVAYALIVLPSHHFSAFSGSVALALLMFPTVARAAESSINLVPAAIREAGLALGLPEWKTMLRVILPAAASGIVTAVMLGIARVAGETAPLLFTALGNPATQFSPSGAIESLPHQIFVYATSPYPDQHRQAWAGAFVLFALILILNLSARLLTRRLTARISAA